MADCQNSNERLFGGAVVLEVADGCPDVKPLESEWKSLAAGTSKGFDFNPNSVTSDADDGGGYVETIITNSDFTLSFEGEVRKRISWISTALAGTSLILLVSLRPSVSPVCGCAWIMARLSLSVI